MLAAIAEFENELRRERQQEGIANARERKVKFGRRPKLTPDIATKIIEDKFTHSLPMNALENRHKLSRATLYRVLAACRSQHGQESTNDDELQTSELQRAPIVKRTLFGFFRSAISTYGFALEAS